MSNRNKEQTRQYINRNPLNIRYSEKNKWFGQVGCDERGFVKFNSFSTCYRAAMMILRSYRKQRAVTLQDIIYKWAPPTENNTSAYVNSICKMIGTRTSEPYVIEPSTVIDLKNRELVGQILFIMTRVETGWTAAQAYFIKEYIERGYELAVTTPDYFK